MDLGEGDNWCKVPFSSSCIEDTCCLHDVSLMTLVLVTWLRSYFWCFHSKVTLSPFHTIFFGRKSLCKAQVQGVDYFPLLSGPKYPLKLLGILHERCVSFFPIDLSIQSSIYISMDSWVLIFYCELLFSPTLFILLVKLFQFWPLGALSIGSLPIYKMELVVFLLRAFICSL